jgi:tetratricopeptide (TPR) repeat protein
MRRQLPFRGIMFTLMLALVAFTGCRTLDRIDIPTTTGADRPIPVPFIAQRPGYCGPAALAMVAQYYGHAVTQDEIGSAIYLPEINGSLTTELAAYAGKFGLWVRQYRGSTADLRQKIHAGVPLIVLGTFGGNHHYFLVLGFDARRQTVTVHSDSRPFLEMSLDDFLRHWSRMQRWTMLVCPPDRVTWAMSAAEHNDLGLFLERSGKPVAAAGHYGAAADLDPTNSYYSINLGNALLAQGLVREAANAYARAVKLAPDNADALNNLAWAYAELGANLEEAIALCERAITLWPSQRAAYLDTLGWVYLKQGNTAKAVEILEQALVATSDRQENLRRMIRQHLEVARAQGEK